MSEHGTMEHGIPVEQRNTLEQRQNNRTPLENSRIPTEHQRNTGTPGEIRNHTKQKTIAVILNKI